MGERGIVLVLGEVEGTAFIALDQSLPFRYWIEALDLIEKNKNYKLKGSKIFR